jgi:serine/threonine-protein kinase
MDDDSRFCPRCGESTPVKGTRSVASTSPEPARGTFDTIAAGSHPALQAKTNSYGSPKGEALTGATIDEKYLIEHRIGTGGMGSVYCATRLMIGDKVAIKILHPEQVADSQAVERFRREAQAAARLKHPNAVTLYDFGVSQDGLIYLVMEMVEGENLRSLIQKQGPLAPAAAAEIINQVCAALDEAHAQGIIHRDLKPDNIVVWFVTNGLRIKVLDFGIARMRDVSISAGNLTQTGAVMGTPHYMSPEQCMGAEIDSRSDIYSLGIVLYEMLSGQVPFRSTASTAVAIQHVTQEPPPLRSINLSISPAVEAVVMRALQKRPEDRPQTAGALAQELRESVSGVSSSGAQQLFSPPPFGQHISSGANTPVSNAPASGAAPTIQFQTPSWASRAATPVGMPLQTDVAPKSGRKTLPIVIALLVIVLAAGAVLWFLKAGKSKAKDEPIKEATAEITPPPGMAYVAGGEFLMGSDDGPISERPRHKVYVNAFFIDLYEVTCEEYQKFILATGRQSPDSWQGKQYPAGAARQPVTGVTWDDAAAYAAWAGKRLPTEEEWEYAARGSEGRRYPWGDEFKEGRANIDTSAIGHPSDAGIFREGASPFGVFDMVGNVWEWTSTLYEAYPGGELTDRKMGELRVIRGGCYESSRDQATTTFRLGWPARPIEKNTNYDQTGFRCARDVPVSSDSK